jgi:hypothetical protein
VNCVPRENLVKNIGTNLAYIPHTEWVDQLYKPDTRLTGWVLSAGPSLRKALEQGTLSKRILESDPRNIIFAVKHALPILKEYNIVPHFCVVLDPRDIKKESTHGVIREELYDAAPEETCFLVASMTSPTVTKYLLDKNQPVVGWHAAVDGLDEYKDVVKVSVDGGTCAAMRCIQLLHTLGFRKVNYVGLDSSLPGGTEPSEVDKKKEAPEGGKPKYQKVYIGSDGPFWTTGELIAQAQDIERLFRQGMALDIEVNFFGLDRENSMVGALLEAQQNTTKKKHIFEVFDFGPEARKLIK